MRADQARAPCYERAFAIFRHVLVVEVVATASKRLPSEGRALSALSRPINLGRHKGRPSLTIPAKFFRVLRARLSPARTLALLPQRHLIRVLLRQAAHRTDDTASLCHPHRNHEEADVHEHRFLPRDRL